MFKGVKGIVILFVIYAIVLICCDYLDIITKLGLSVSLWSGFVTGIFPIALTIYLWKVEEKDRKAEIKEESRFQQKLILQGTYIEYFENLLEQIRNFTIYIECYLLSEETILGKKLSTEEKAKSLIKDIASYASEKEIWKLNYRIYPFKCIDIDIFDYEYNGNKINLRAFMPYINISNQLSTILNSRKNYVSMNSVYTYEDIDEEEKIEIAIKLLKNKKNIKELYRLLNYLKDDIEKRIAFDIK